MNELVKALMNQKGLKSYRALVAVALIYIGGKVQKLDDVERRLTVLESRPVATRASERPGTNGANTVTIGPEWPKRIVSAFGR